MNALFAFLAPFRGLARVFDPGLRGLVIGPLLINIAVIVGIGIAAGFGFEILLDTWLPAGWDWLAWLLWPLFVLTLLVGFGVSAVALAAIIASPFSGPLAYRTARGLGHEPRQPARSLAGEMGHATATALRKFGYYALLFIPVLLITVIPGINLLASLAWFVFGSWVLAVEFQEPPLANDGLTLAEIRKGLGTRRPETLAFGAGTTLLAMVPVVNLLLVPAAVIGATHLWARQQSRG
ncbi:CysZ protein [Thioalkalivibrio sp. ALE21]|uniref:sulfate transporter CysZ n=1 Tax=Thioalkalivibrio sp. ALE21 TaxID=1158175 RepID=UPI000D893326|nr:sulfate transporter CysZ [Thioalkalivibrio sp. ALE21]PYG01269.1 CysZ protein [Thioalkalivibrio sp. ALE21]